MNYESPHLQPLYNNRTARVDLSLTVLAGQYILYLMNNATKDETENAALDEALTWARVQPTWRGYLMALEEILEEEL